MKTLRAKRKIIDRLALSEAATALLDLGETQRTAALLACYRDALEAGTATVRRRFEKNQDGELAVLGNCHLIDQVIRVMYDVAANGIYPAANPTSGEQVCIVA